MKTLLIVLIPFVLLAMPIAATEPSPTPGRFQLLAARVTLTGMIDGKAVQTEESIVLKIDSNTGETWRLVNMNVDYKSIQGWQRIETFTGTEKFSKPRSGPTQ